MRTFSELSCGLVLVPWTSAKNPMRKPKTLCQNPPRRILEEVAVVAGFDLMLLRWGWVIGYPLTSATAAAICASVTAAGFTPGRGVGW